MTARAHDILRMLLVDDHPVVRRGLRDILVDAFDRDGAVIQEVGSGREAIALVQRTSWSIIILDLSLPDTNGLDVLKRIRELRSHIPVLVLSMHAISQFARRAMDAGADGYLTKESADTELVTAVSRVIAGGTYVGREMLERISLEGRHAGGDRMHERLSEREFQVLRMIGSGKTVSEIAHELSLSVKTVSTYRSRVLEKMRMRTNAELTHYVIRHGLAE